MPNVCLESEGCQVVVATSWDESHPPESIIDGKPNTFWTTTGMYPQEIVITFPVATRITAIETKTAAIKTLVIQKSANQAPVGWEEIASKDFEMSESQQLEQHKIDPGIVRHLRLVVKDGFDTFAAVYSMNVDGSFLEEDFTRGR
eukprot:m.358232 g.358232  ORF g.358232 m.358232 type:complete len:145 (+) comp18078_c0_seq1:207-641(+)